MVARDSQFELQAARKFLLGLFASDHVIQGMAVVQYDTGNHIGEASVVNDLHWSKYLRDKANQLMDRSEQNIAEAIRRGKV